MPIDLNKYKAIYLEEANSLIKLMNASLLELEKKPNNKNLFYELQRAIHTLKGLASTMNYIQTVNVCHRIEDLFAKIENHQLDLKICSDLLFKCFDFFEENIKSLVTSNSELYAGALLDEIQRFITSGNTSLLNSNDMPEIPVTFDKIRTLSVRVDKLDKLMNLAEELLGSKMKFDVIKQQSNDPDLVPAIESLGRLISDLQYNIMQIRLVPIEFIFNRFLRMTRDLAKQQKKEVNIHIEGSEIELDRLLIDELGESLVHLVRNAIDHGIEMPEIRKNKGKPSQGTITLRATRTKESALIEINDDGEGLNLQLIKNLALQNKLIKSDATDEEIIDTIFLNLSTKKNITTVSGRGLGLFIVKRKMESIGGHIRVESIPDKGTTFYIEIPLSLAIIKALFVKVAEEMYAVPIDIVERLLVVNANNFKGMLEYEVIIYENKEIPIIHLADIFNQPFSSQERQFVVIIQTKNKRIGLVVDSLLSTQEIVVKPLGKSFKGNKYFSGAALVGSGKMVLILDIAHLLPSRKRTFNLLS